MKIGEVTIAEIEFDPKPRDEIHQLLKGLHYIDCTPALRKKVFEILEKDYSTGTDITNDRPGMELWKILVLVTVRLNCNGDYDKLKEMADNHQTLR